MIVALRCNSMRTGLYSSLHLNEVFSATNKTKKCSGDRHKYSTFFHKKVKKLRIHRLNQDYYIAIRLVVH